MSCTAFDPCLIDSKAFSDSLRTKSSGSRQFERFRKAGNDQLLLQEPSAMWLAALNAIRTHPDFSILEAHIIGGETLEKIAFREKCHKSNISRKLKRMREKLVEAWWERLFPDHAPPEVMF